VIPAMGMGSHVVCAGMQHRIMRPACPLAERCVCSTSQVIGCASLALCMQHRVTSVVYLYAAPSHSLVVRSVACVRAQDERGGPDGLRRVGALRGRELHQVHSPTHLILVTAATSVTAATAVT
jgi:hypothetical protein